MKFTQLPRTRNKTNPPPARGGVPAQAGGVVGASHAHVTTPSASHPPRPSQLAASSWAFAGSDTWSSKPRLTLEKEGSKAGPVILLGALRIWRVRERARCRRRGNLRGRAGGAA